LKSVSQDYDIFFFTASTREYANPIIDAIAPETPPERRFFRDSCTQSYGYSVKDLRKIGRPLNRVLLVDDLEGSALMQPGNLVRIAPWQGGEDAALLDQLLPLLQEIVGETDLPKAVRSSAQRHAPKDLFAPVKRVYRIESDCSHGI
jgi:TFIIF-interacting CTD phosphatase-like protein